ncbi:MULTISPECIES: hypothetical protein [Klebsiella]|uniref:hypothetical protein n=1 Tax=Klebsiella TaxID=570 RepID=UPI00068D720D|nr:MULTISPECIES: hypothetical protein [Klebsiella]PNO41372.1 hypothetical protein MC52_001580 [Klebsiella michiganensis]SYV38439.1 Uncharacterised protein [Klebsiella pneumoniae]HDX8762737.1 hypothetical protein [Klebsiella michiganensis]HED1425802.1 hypothetical protein [Klebsiella michiganensis]
MSNTANELSGAAKDVLHALFFRGALESGDLPSKSGAAELRVAGLAETRTLRAQHRTASHFTFLTKEGQECAIRYLVDSDYGIQRNNPEIPIVIIANFDSAPSLDQIEVIRQFVEKAMVQTHAHLRRIL